MSTALKVFNFITTGTLAKLSILNIICLVIYNSDRMYSETHGSEKIGKIKTHIILNRDTLGRKS